MQPYPPERALDYPPYAQATTQIGNGDGRAVIDIADPLSIAALRDIVRQERDEMRRCQVSDFRSTI